MERLKSSFQIWKFNFLYMKIMIHLKSHIYIDTFLKTKGEYKHGKIKYFYY